MQYEATLEERDGVWCVAGWWDERDADRLGIPPRSMVDLSDCDYLHRACWAVLARGQHLLLNHKGHVARRLRQFDPGGQVFRSDRADGNGHTNPATEERVGITLDGVLALGETPMAAVRPTAAQENERPCEAPFSCDHCPRCAAEHLEGDLFHCPDCGGTEPKALAIDAPRQDAGAAWREGYWYGRRRQEAFERLMQRVRGLRAERQAKTLAVWLCVGAGALALWWGAAKREGRDAWYKER